MASRRRKKLRDRWAGLKIIQIHMGVFDYSVRIVIGPEELAVKYTHWFTKKDFVPQVEGRRGFCALSQPYCPIIWIPSKPRTPREFATLAHECFHAVGHVTRWAAIEHCEETEEVFCHALGHLVNGILEQA